VSIVNKHVTLGTAAQQIVEPSVMPQRVSLHNASKSSNNFIYIGGTAVTSSTGIHIDPAETLQLELLPLESIYAVSAPAGIVVHVLVQRFD
jgi:hypothetical protein